MNDKSLLQEALGLTHAIFSVNIGATVNLANHWHTVAYFHLYQSCKSLGAIYLILARLGKEVMNPADILVRHMFELAVRLKYLEAHPDKVPDFLEHHVKSPRQPFGKLKQMSKEVGLLDHYCTVYELTSQHAHGGAQGLPLAFLRLLGYEGIRDWEPAKILATGIYYYDLVLSTNITVFPDLESQFADFQPGTEWHKRLETLWQTIGTQARDNGRAAASQ